MTDVFDYNSKGDYYHRLFARKNKEREKKKKKKEIIHLIFLITNIIRLELPMPIEFSLDTYHSKQ